MDFDFTQEQQIFRKEIEDFLKKELPPDWNDKTLCWPGAYGAVAQTEKEFESFCRQFQLKVGSKGWLSLGWPKEYGGANSWMKHAIVDEVMSYYRAPFTSVATSIAGPTIVEVGSDEMKKEWLPRISSGEAGFWLGYSEPNAGSDLVALETTAVEDGDDFIVNGQKTWSSGAHVTDYCWLLAKTDLEAPKHKSASLMIVDNKTPGITIRPIENMLGFESFNDVFFDHVRVPKKNVVGEINQGFYYVMLALQYERLVLGVGAFKRVFEELVDYVKRTNQNGKPLAENDSVRKKLATLSIDIEMLYGLFWRTVWSMEKGSIQEIEASSLKLFATELSKKLAGAGIEILGLYGQLEQGSEYAPLGGWISSGYLDAISGPIGAGTSEVQKGIIATRGLGLPRN